MNRTSARILAGTLLTLAAAAPSSAQAQVTTSGTLTWNANGSLRKLVGDGSANPANNVTCTYTHDDMGRLSQIDCGAGKWGQSYTYDAFGNLGQSPLTDRTGTTFQPDYNTSTNRYSGTGFSYDANGNLTSDGVHTYAWDAEGKLRQLDGGAAIIYDAFGRRVEQPSSTGTTQILYGADGSKLALMNGQTVRKAFVPLPGGATAVYNSGGLAAYRHPDWLGSSRLGTTPSGGLYYDGAYSPFGEMIAETGTADRSFTGQNRDLDLLPNPILYDFPYREYQSLHGRWLSPDPAGIAAADPANPQSWNRYSYVWNDPLTLVDPTGLNASEWNQVETCLFQLPHWMDPTLWTAWCMGGAGPGGGAQNSLFGGTDSTADQSGGQKRDTKPANNCPPNVKKFVIVHRADANTLANDLRNGVTAQEVLATAGNETGWGNIRTLAKYGNFFGLHGTGYAGQSDRYTTPSPYNVLTPVFPLSNGFLLSGRVFVKTVRPFLEGVNAADPRTFFSVIHAHGWGTGTPGYVDLMIQDKPGNRGPYALAGACIEE